MTSENESTPLERVDKSDASQHNSNTDADVPKQASVGSADRMDLSPTPALQNGPQSLPHTSAVPSGASTPAVETADTNGAAPYGTRSRNRNGASRPNYAEDKELDHLIEANGKIAKSGPQKAAAPPAGAELEAADLGKNTNTNNNNNNNNNSVPRRGFAAVNTTLPEVNSNAPAAKDLIPGTSTFSANLSINGNGSAPQSKKRKQPGANTTVSTTSAVNNSTSRTPRSSAGARQHHETNMMTFEGCGARLN